MILNARDGKALPVYGDGKNVRDWLYVEDHCEAIATVLRGGRPGETYNIGGWNEKPNLEIVQTICDLVDEIRPGDDSRRKLITFVKDRPGHDRRYAMKTVAASVKPVSFELGGKNAAIVFADCDFDEAVSGLADAAFLNTGQVCLCAERVYVERGIFDRFVAALKQKAESLHLGYPTDAETELGPLISSQHREKVLAYYRLAREEGAKVITGGATPEFGNSLDRGFYVQPTIYTGLPESARCVKEEIFGPVCHVAPFDTEEEAVNMANDTKYGLAASVWTTNLKRGHRVAQQMNVGITWVNCWFLRDLRTPFGGAGLSGIGREGGMLIALPNVDGTFGCILFLPFEGPDSIAQLTTHSTVREFFQLRFPDALEVMPNLEENFFANPVGAMVTIKCSPWHFAGQSLLLGDAAHAIVPFFGQGINCGFEDCTVLLELLDRHGADWERIFPEFEAARKENTNAIADMAVENFVEMRDRVADPRFLFRKNIELALQSRYANLFVPKYAMVTFHRVPYSTALKRGQVQDRILTELCNGIERIEDLDRNRAETLIRELLTPLELS